MHDQKERLTVHIIDELERSLYDYRGGTMNAVRRTRFEVVNIEPTRHAKCRGQEPIVDHSEGPETDRPECLRQDRQICDRPQKPGLP